MYGNFRTSITVAEEREPGHDDEGGEGRSPDGRGGGNATLVEG